MRMTIEPEYSHDDALKAIAEINKSVAHDIATSNDDELLAKGIKRYKARYRDALKMASATTEAMTLFQHLHEKGHREGSYWYINGFYESREGLLKNFYQKDSVAMLTNRAALGEARAIHALGICNYLGIGMAQNDLSAVEYFKRAAKTNYTPALYSLSLCYEFGHGVTANKETALEYAKKASANGFKHSDRLIERLEAN
jgi:TPR repeat protein